MAASASGAGTSKLNRNVLLQAWARLSVYDKTSSALKNKFIQQRKWVIGLTLVATIASVLTGILGQNTLAIALAIISIVLPIVAAALMNDLIKFTGRTAWIKYRYIAEMMRMHIYLYRTQAGDYAVGPVGKMDTILSNNLDAVIKDAKLDDAVPLNGQEPTEEKDIIDAITKANSFTKGDDGLSEIMIEEYIKWRIDNQRGWYKGKIDTDFNKLKKFARSAQILLAVGSLVSALAGASINVQLVTLVAITNVISVAINQWAEVSLVGKTHSIFQIAWDQLGNLKRYWASIEDDPENQDVVKRAAEFAALAQRVENVLQWERQEWYEMALQTEADNDKAILGNLTRLNQRAEEAQKKS